MGLDNGHWNFPEQMGGKEFSGFVYLIKDKLLGDFYIGKKHYRTSKLLDSGWRTYNTSSKWMKELTAEGGLSGFEFHVLEQYKKKGMVGYAETWSLCHVEAPTRRDCHSRRIEKVQWQVSERITDRHRQRLNELVLSEVK